MRRVTKSDLQRIKGRKKIRCGVKIKDHGGADPNEYYLLNNKGEKIDTLTQTEAMDKAIYNYNHGIFIGD